MDILLNLQIRVWVRAPSHRSLMPWWKPPQRNLVVGKDLCDILHLDRFVKPTSEWNAVLDALQCCRNVNSLIWCRFKSDFGLPTSFFFYINGFPSVWHISQSAYAFSDNIDLWLNASVVFVGICRTPKCVRNPGRPNPTPPGDWRLISDRYRLAGWDKTVIDKDPVARASMAPEESCSGHQLRCVTPADLLLE